MGWGKKAFLLLALVLIGLGISKIDLNRFPKGECPFCNETVLSTQRVYQGASISIILPYKPVTPGHTLIIPNRHVARFEGLNPEEIAEMGALIQKMEPLLSPLFQSGEYLLLQKNGRGVGQSVDHVHVHMIPKPNTMSQLTYILRFFIRPLLKPESVDSIREEVELIRSHF
jgi:diadenosine tetraphosphate (Ap4A) HIT family hydrolase